MLQRQKMNLLTVFNLSTVFTFACLLVTKAENLQWQENSSTQNIPCRNRCLKMDNKFQDYMRKGSNSFSENKIHVALRYYDKAAELSLKNVDILENLAECYSKLGYHYAALKEANHILKEEPPYCFEGVYYKAKALLGLQRYVESIRFVISQMAINEELKKSRGLNNLLAKLVLFEYQQRTGHYDIQRLFKNDLLKGDYADYIGPVEIKDIPGKGRGLIATADIRTGQLLLVNKAFAIVYQNDSEDQDWQGDELVEAVAKKLKAEPEHADWFYKSYAGPEMSYLTDGVGNNSVDYRRIQGICAYTSFSSTSFKSMNFDVRKGRGLWILAAYLNHNGFDSNSCQFTYGDIMAVRAIKNISKGEEITSTYVSIEETFEERDEFFRMHRFECSCSLCQADRNDSIEIREKRNRILARAKNRFENPKTIVEELEQLRPNNPDLNVYLINPLQILAKNFYFKGEYDKAAEAMIKAHKIVKNSPLATSMVEFSMAILDLYIIMDDREKILQWIDIVKENLIIAYGSLEIVKVLEFRIEESLAEIGIKF